MAGRYGCGWGCCGCGAMRAGPGGAARGGTVVCGARGVGAGRMVDGPGADGQQVGPQSPRTGPSQHEPHGSQQPGEQHASPGWTRKRKRSMNEGRSQQGSQELRGPAQPATRPSAVNRAPNSKRVRNMDASSIVKYPKGLATCTADGTRRRSSHGRTRPAAASIMRHACRAGKRPVKHRRPTSGLNLEGLVQTAQVECGKACQLGIFWRFVQEVADALEPERSARSVGRRPPAG